MAPSTSASRPFSFLRLPVELQVRVLRCDPFLTLALIRASNSVRELFQTHSNSVLRSLLHLWPPQLRHLIRTLLAVRQGLLLSSPANAEDIRQLYNRYLEPASGHPEHIDFPPLQTLKLLCTLTLDIDILSQIIVHRAADVAAKAFRAPAIEGWPPLTSILSQEELHRIERAVLRLLLYFQLRRHKPGGAYLSLADVFIGELSSWEIEEWFTAVNFVCYFVYHVNESEFRPLYNQYSFRSFFEDISPDSFLRAARSTVEFLPWHSLRNAINEHGSASPALATPLNRFSDGAKYFFVGLKHSSADIGYEVDLQYQYRRVGLSFWDSKRLATWLDLPPSLSDDPLPGGPDYLTECSKILEPFENTCKDGWGPVVQKFTEYWEENRAFRARRTPPWAVK